VNDQQAAVFELDCHHLQRPAGLVVTEIHQARVRIRRRVGRRRLVVAQAAVLDDVPGAVAGGPDAWSQNAPISDPPVQRTICVGQY